MWKEFKAFIANDNILQLATAVVMGTAFTAIVNSLVNDIFMPIIVAVTGQADVSGLALKLGNTTIGIGMFLQAIINFLLIAAMLFTIIKALEKVKRPAPAETEEVPGGPSETELLQEILTELRNK
ncbi:large conductance mechanosensitive channel protein MscL [Tuanshanicoccus lijuaniae]|uniref:large conductance mechanosensitive channel protein MscL n=1 Tax=Aerococcaceae bacterium zg-1292 TaxID=2774330 RepID=UPI00193530DC|nr:large conductance mechanosensitive channel protein MscL [Aerococcaceae bacterium zg-1292]MBF6626460.1 large conductance mechanosensitive channel protein MscL [Aerococcaceae bacterium zg-BR9]MBS4455663.1 large conductance mechanosensitive channel protein MscL [Aerococcaceae bacterium zg-A91]MBS4457414.1 large conductance mechanosensitive channel protein MscL [Aerococcaceae bacterium zg-BR33]QQA37133.1 large conductance mechanosensitive channel protein MscL [Aerococcaceae bacterium zg-1292]